MGYMDQALREHQLPTSDDLEIQLPTRREPKKEAPASEPHGLGQHGGGADGTPASEAHADVTASGASGDAAPAPQRDDPDEGEHTDSTDEQIAARAARDAVPPAGENEATAELVEQAPPEQKPVDEPAPESAPEPERHQDLTELLASSEGTSPRTYKRVGASYGKVPMTNVKRFPQPAVDRVRAMLALVAGGEFAESISAPSLLTAFVMANTGLELDVDENTAAAVDAFRENDPRMVDVEDKLDLALENINQLGRAMNIGLRRIGETGHIVDELEFGVAFLVADRVVRLADPQTDETTVEIVQKKSLAVRDRLRSQTKAQRTIEKQREERSIG